MNRAFALLIGIDDYRAYDESAGNAPGTSDLPAGKNDVRAAYQLCRALGIEAENIHVLTSPRLAAGEIFPGVTPGYVGEATRAEIEAQVAWLAKALSHAPGAPDAPVGLLSYSGHGDFLDGHLALCPSDARAVKGAGGDADLENVIGFPSIRALLARAPGAAESLTVVLDCCHAAAGADRERGARASLTGRTRTAKDPVQSLGARMLMAAPAGETAYQSVFCGEAHGALTWALTVVADQWRVISERGYDRLTLSHGELRDRAQRLLDAISIPQRIALVGPPGIEDLTFFHRGAADAGDTMATGPDRARSRIQLDPSASYDWVRYEFLMSYEADGTRQTATGQVLSTRTASPQDKSYGPYADGREYWALGADFVRAFNSGDSCRTLTITVTPGNWGDDRPLSGTVNLKDDNSVGWDNPKPSGVDWLYCAAANAGLGMSWSDNTLTVYWRLLASGTSAPRTGTYALSAETELVHLQHDRQARRHEWHLGFLLRIGS
ncbi:MAG: caspase family protein [Minicystis sp.]